jgi:hypothetical protein
VPLARRTLVDYVFGLPDRNVNQETGVLVKLAALANYQNAHERGPAGGVMTESNKEPLDGMPTLKRRIRSRRRSCAREEIWLNTSRASISVDP